MLDFTAISKADGNCKVQSGAGHWRKKVFCLLFELLVGVGLVYRFPDLLFGFDFTVAFEDFRGCHHSW